MSTLNKIDAIKTARGTNVKKDILRTLDAGDKQLFELAYDPAKVFWFQLEPEELPPPVGEPGLSDDETRQMFIDIACGYLATRKATGREAEKIVRNLFSQFTKRQQDIYLRILNKDLGIGVEAKTYLAVHKGAFELFECQLCNAWEGQDVLGWYVDPKFDGLRVIGIPDDNLVYTPYSRNGKLLFGLDHITRLMTEVAKKHGQPFVFDGEGCGPHWRDYAQARTKSLKESALKFYCFDLMTRDEWYKDNAPIQAVRRENLYKTFEGIIYDNFICVQHAVITPVHTPEIAMSNAVKEGYEGIILKNPNAPYSHRKNGNWLKKKPRETVDLVILDAEIGDPSGNCANTLGALVMDYKGVRTKIGTGFSFNERERLWRMHQSGLLVGKYAEIDMGPVTPDGKLFHASYLRLRPDKS